MLQLQLVSRRSRLAACQTTQCSGGLAMDAMTISSVIRSSARRVAESATYRMVCFVECCNTFSTTVHTLTLALP